MNRLLSLCIALGLALPAVGQDLEKKISIEIPASRARVAFARLSQEAGVTLQPAANLRDEVFAISAHDVTVGELMKRIAQAESGRWTLQSGVYFLGRDSSTSVLQERAELKARADAIRAEVAKLGEEVKKQPAFDDESARKLAEETRGTFDRMDANPRGARFDLKSTPQKTPAVRAIAKILGSIDPSKLAQIGLNQRVVFSTQPTPMQFSLNGVASSAFRQFVTEQQAYARAYNAGQPSDGTTRIMFVDGFGTPTMGGGDPRLGLGLGLLVVQRRSVDTLGFQMIAADPNLEPLCTGNYGLRLTAPASKPAITSGEEPLKISDEAKEMAKALGGGSGSGAPTQIRAFAVSTSGSPGGEITFQTMDTGAAATSKLSPSLRAKVLEPEKFDPLSFVPGEAMRALAEARKKNLVALLPDTCFTSLTRQFATDVTASQLVAGLGATHGLSLAEDEGWFVVSPSAPFSARSAAVDRGALGRMLRTMDKGWLRLDDVVAFALAESHAPGMGDLDVLYPRLVDASAADRQLMPLATGSFSLYRFYGTLSQGQRQALGSGRSLALGGLSPEQNSLVADMVFNSPQGPTIDGSQSFAPRADSTEVRVAVSRQSEMAAPMPMILGGGGSARTERTIVLPNGIPSDGFLQGSAQTQPIVQAMNSQTGASAMLDATGLAFSRNPPRIPDLALSGSQWDRFRMAHQTSISLKFMFTPRISLTRSLSDQSADANAQAGPYESLPAELRRQVEDLANQMQQAMGKLPMRGGGTTPPPAA